MRTFAALRFAPLIALATLAACGGGGGGGGAAGGGSTNPPTFALSDGNAIAASALALKVIEHPGLVAELPLIAALELDDRRAAQFNLPCGNTFVDLRHTDADSNGTISVGDSLSAEQLAPCAGLTSSKITMRLSAVDLRDLHINGTAEFEVESVAGDRMVGSFALATRVDRVFDYVAFSLTELALTSTRDGKTERLSGARFDRRLTLSAPGYSLDFAGQLDSELIGGTYSFSTPTRFTGVSGMLPTAGELICVAGQTRVRIAVSPAPERQQLTVDYQLDTGTGFGPPAPVRWRDVTKGLLFYWIPNDPPVISSLEVVPADPPTASTVTAHAAATDVDGDALTFRFTWTVGQRTFADFGPAFHTGGLPKGTVVSVTVTVSDGRLETTRSTSFTVANAPPVFTSLTISPPAPRSLDDLTVTAAFEDIDGDALAIRYEWQKNGVAIAGATSATLPRSAYAKNDVVTAIAYVTDGSATVSRQESVTIGDSLPQLTWLALPGAIAHGAPLGVRAVASDPDGDALPASLRFELRYGPAGMTVDATTGEIGWVAGGPMFERSMDVRYGVGTNIDGAGSVAGTVTVEDGDRGYPLARSSLNPAVRYSGLRAGDFDGDGDAEMLLLTERGVLYELEAVGASYRQSWMYPFSLNPAPLALATADIDGDGAHEIFMASGSRLLRLDGVDRRVTASVALPLPDVQWTCGDLEIADLNGDGAVELVCSAALGSLDAGNNHPLLVVDPVTLAATGQTAGGEFGNDVAIGNVDDDPALEIVTWRGFVFDGVTLLQEWQSAETFPGLAVGDVTGDGIAEIVTSYPTDFSGANGRVYSARTRGALFDLPHRGFTTNLVADIDGAPGAEILMAGSRFAAYRYESSGTVSTLFTMVLPDDRGATTLAIADVDHTDARPEFVLGTNKDTIDVADWPAAGIRIEWSTAGLEPALPQTLSGPFFGGELIRSPAHAPQPLFMTPTTGFNKGARLLSLDPMSGDLTFSPEVPQGESFWWDDGDVAVTDFDGDGTDEVFMSVADRLEPAVGAYDFFAGELVYRSAPPPTYAAIDIDHGDFNGDGNEDLVALTENGWLDVYDVFAGALLFSEQIPPGGEAVAVADLDGAGPPEIIATTYEQVLVFSRASTTEPFVRRYEAGPFHFAGDLTAGDVDDDGRVDLFLGYRGVDSYVVQRFNERLEPGARLALDAQPSSLSIESSGFGRKNLIGTFSEAEGWRLRAFDSLLGEEVWRSPPIHGPFAPNSVHFVDIAGDGAFRIAFGTYDGVFLTR